MTDSGLRIAALLKEVEQDDGIRILYACESGSRAWGFESVDSDWDVRFIFVRPATAYLSLDPPPHQVERQRESPIGLLDVVGWDLTKALRLVRKSNPALLEWVRSPIIYAQEDSFLEQFRFVVDRSFSPKPSGFHYGNIARSNFTNFLQGDQVRLKRYFYVLRAVLAFQWVKIGRGIPPMPFVELFDALVPSDSPVASEVRDLLDRKRSGVELGDGPRLPAVHTFIEESVAEIEGDLAGLTRETVIAEDLPSNLELNAFLRTQIGAIPAN